jgi:hypothetical protein
MEDFALLFHLLGAFLLVGRHDPRRSRVRGGRRRDSRPRLAPRLATEQAPATPELRALLDDGTALARARNYLSALLPIAIIVLMSSNQAPGAHPQRTAASSPFRVRTAPRR